MVALLAPGQGPRSHRVVVVWIGMMGVRVTVVMRMPMSMIVIVIVIVIVAMTMIVVVMMPLGLVTAFDVMVMGFLR